MQFSIKAQISCFYSISKSLIFWGNIYFTVLLFLCHYLFYDHRHRMQSVPRAVYWCPCFTFALSLVSLSWWLLASIMGSCFIINYTSHMSQMLSRLFLKTSLGSHAALDSLPKETGCWTNRLLDSYHTLRHGIWNISILSPVTCPSLDVHWVNQSVGLSLWTQ